MYELKENGKVFTSKFVGTGPSSYEKRIYRAAISQRLRYTALRNTLDDLCKGRSPPTPGVPTYIRTVAVPSSGRHRWLPALQSLPSSADFLIGRMNGDLAADCRENSGITPDVSHWNLDMCSVSQWLQTCKLWTCSGLLLLWRQIKQLTLGFLIFFLWHPLLYSVNQY